MAREASLLRHVVEQLHAEAQRLTQRDDKGAYRQGAEVLAHNGPRGAHQPRQARARLAALVLRTGGVVVPGRERWEGAVRGAWCVVRSAWCVAA